MSTKGPQTEMERNAKIRIRIFEELFSTENTYHKALEDFAKQTSDYQDNPNIQKQGEQIAQMEEGSKRLVAKMQEISDKLKLSEPQELTSGSIKELLAELNKINLKVYTDYLTNYEDYRDQLEEQFTDPVQLAQMNSLAIAPVQRIPRYILLLKEMLKRTEEGSEEHRALQVQIKKLDLMAAGINEAIKKSHTPAKLAKMAEKVEERAVKAGRIKVERFLDETPVKFISDNIKNAIRQAVKNKKSSEEINVIYGYAQNLKKLQENKPNFFYNLLYREKSAAYNQLIAQVQGLLSNNLLALDPNKEIIDRLNKLSPESTTEELTAASKAISAIRISGAKTKPPKPPRPPRFKPSSIDIERDVESSKSKLERSEAIKQLPTPPAEILAQRRAKSDSAPAAPILPEFSIDKRKGTVETELTPPPLPPRPPTRKSAPEKEAEPPPPLPPRPPPRPRGPGGSNSPTSRTR